MARRRKNIKMRFSVKRLKVFAIFIGIALLVLGGTYVFQPPVTRGEIKRAICAWAVHSSDISLVECIQDVVSVWDNSAPKVEYVPVENEALGGFPVAERKLQYLDNGCFFIGYDEELRLPAWVAYRLFDGKWHDAGKRPEAFLPDSRLSSPVKSEDYTGSGYDRGHLAPNSAIAHCYGTDAQLKTFVLSNVVPQKHGFNAGIWKQLERRELRNYALRYGEVWIVAGPVFGKKIRRTSTGLPIPEKLFKIIACIRGGKVYALAFLMDQKADGRIDHYLSSIDEIESLTGLDFMPKLTPEQQTVLEANAARKAW